MRMLALLWLTVIATLSVQAAESCRTIHGRAHLYSGDGQLRIWQVGTHHEYEPDASSWDRVEAWLEAGVGAQEANKNSGASAAALVYLFADFEICPIEPLKEGAVQRAEVKSAYHRRYVPAN